MLEDIRYHQMAVFLQSSLPNFTWRCLRGIMLTKQRTPCRSTTRIPLIEDSAKGIISCIKYRNPWKVQLHLFHLILSQTVQPIRLAPRVADNAKNSDSKFQKMKQNLKNASKCYKESSSLSQDSGDLSMSSPRRKSCEFEMIDISSDDLLASPCVYKITYTDYLLFGMSKC